MGNQAQDNKPQPATATPEKSSFGGGGSSFGGFKMG